MLLWHMMYHASQLLFKKDKFDDRKAVTERDFTLHLKEIFEISELRFGEKD